MKNVISYIVIIVCIIITNVGYLIKINYMERQLSKSIEQTDLALDLLTRSEKQTSQCIIIAKELKHINDSMLLYNSKYINK